MEHTTNIITLRGELAELPEFSHENHGRKFFRFTLNVPGSAEQWILCRWWRRSVC